MRLTAPIPRPDRTITTGQWEKDSIPVVNSLFSRETTQQCSESPVDLVVFRHVLEHIHDLDDFFAAVDAVLADDGLLAIEVPDAASIVKGGLYAHFYHEHLSYFGMASLGRVLNRFGFEIVEARLVDIHGGSLFVVARRTQDDAVHIDGAEEVTLDDCRAYAAGVDEHFSCLRELVAAELKAGRRVAGYGAAHRTAVMCALAGLSREHVAYLVDRIKHLHGYLTPKSHIPIHSPDHLYEDWADSLVVFATSFEDEIFREQSRYSDNGGRFISLTSDPHIVE